MRYITLNGEQDVVFHLAPSPALQVNKKPVKNTKIWKGQTWKFNWLEFVWQTEWLTEKMRVKNSTFFVEKDSFYLPVFSLVAFVLEFFGLGVARLEFSWQTEWVVFAEKKIQASRQPAPQLLLCRFSSKALVFEFGKLLKNLKVL